MEMNDMNEKLEFYYSKKIKIHIDLHNGTFLNGSLTSHPKENIWFMTEDKLGKDIIVFVNDIKVLEQYMEKRA
jgi:hypothetical protein